MHKKYNRNCVAFTNEVLFAQTQESIEKIIAFQFFQFHLES